jgi:hypothetical protein
VTRQNTIGVSSTQPYSIHGSVDPIEGTMSARYRLNSLLCHAALGTVSVEFFEPQPPRRPVDPLRQIFVLATAGASRFLGLGLIRSLG